MKHLVSILKCILRSNFAPICKVWVKSNFKSSINLHLMTHMAVARTLQNVRCLIICKWIMCVVFCGCLQRGGILSHLSISFYGNNCLTRDVCEEFEVSKFVKRQLNVIPYIFNSKSPILNWNQKLLVTVNYHKKPSVQTCFANFVSYKGWNNA